MNKNQPAKDELNNASEGTMPESAPGGRQDGAPSTDVAEETREESVGDLCDELVSRWKGGQRLPAEHYLRRDPVMAVGGDDAFDLIYAEFLVREELGETPTLDEFCARFPEHVDQLRQQIRLHRAFNEMYPSGALTGAETLAQDPDDAIERWPAPVGYEIECVLGRGGMGVVYKARQVRLNRVVALKMIRAGAHASSEDSARFLAEAEVIARFQHPNIVQVHAVGDFDGQPFFEMEYVSGGSLAAQLDGTPRKPREAATLLQIIARAIHEAHKRGIVHRDLKPANVLLTDDGAPKIADFGLAKMLDVDSGLTRTDSVLGSPAYMAPEQAGGNAKHVGPESDVYAMGAILYEMLTGRPPFSAPSALETLDLVRHSDPVPLSRLQPSLPRDAETICLRCLAKDYTRRYPSAEALADDLKRFLAGDPILARPTGGIERTWRWARRNRLVAALATAVAVLFAGGFAGMAILWARAQTEARSAKALAAKEKRTRGEVGRLSAGLALDQGLAMAKIGQAARGLHFMAETLRIDEGDDARLQHAARANISVFARQLARPIGSAALRARPNVSCFNTDGRMYAAGGEDGAISLLDLDSMEWVGPLGSHAGPVRALAFSTDLKMLASGGDDGCARIWNVDAGRSRGAELRHGRPVDKVLFRPDGKVLASFSNNDLWLWDLEASTMLAGPIRCGDRVTGAAFSPDGAMLTTVTFAAQIERRDGKTGRLIGPTQIVPDVIWDVAFSPDGLRFVVGFGRPDLKLDGKVRQSGARIYESNGEPFGPLLAHDLGVNHVAYRDDGKVILTGDAQGTARLWSAVDGQPLTPPMRGEGPVKSLAFSPDRHCVLVGSEVGTARLWNATDGLQLGATLEQAGELEVVFRSDGRSIALAGDQRVRVLDTANARTPVMRLHHDVEAIVFRPDSKAILTGGEDVTARLWSLADGRPIAAPMAHPAAILALAFSADGKKIATGARDPFIRIWDAATGSPIGAPIRQGHWVCVVRFDSQGDRLLVGSADNSVRMIDVASGRVIGSPLKCPEGKGNNEVRFLEIVPNSNVGVFGSRGGSVGRIDLTTGRRIGESQFYPAPLTDMLLSPDGSTLMVLANESIYLSDASTGRSLSRPSSRNVTCCAFLPDSTSILIGGKDRTARRWDLASDRPVGAPMEHDQSLRSVAVSPDGKTFVSVTADDQARIWDVLSGKPIGPVFRSSNTSLEQKPIFSPDGRNLAVVNGAAEVWPAPVGETGDFEAIRDQLRRDTGLEMDARGGFAPVRSFRNAMGEGSPPKFDGAWHYREAGNLLSRGEPSGALSQISAMVADRSQDWFAHALRARALSELGNASDAVAEDERAMALADPRQALAWKTHRVFDALHARRWSEAVGALNIVLATRPENTALYLERGWALARLGDWVGAGADIDRGVKGQAVTIFFFYHRALVALNAGDFKTYRAICERHLVNRGAATARGDPQLDVLTGWICELGPEGVADYGAALALVRPVVHPSTGAGDRKALIAFGALLYRAGRYKDAIPYFARDQTEWKDQGTPQGWAFSAMAHQRLGNHEEAVRCLTRCVAHGPTNGDSVEDFWSEVDVQTVRQEAVRLVFGVTLPVNVFAP
jgi:eukaryotic-like serine/threonine-protein kinase